MLFTERTRRAFDSREMSFGVRKKLVEMSKTSPFFIFPKSSTPDAEKQLPARERVIAIHKYVQNHPDIELEEWVPVL